MRRTARRFRLLWPWSRRVVWRPMRPIPACSRELLTRWEIDRADEYRGLDQSSARWLEFPARASTFCIPIYLMRSIDELRHALRMDRGRQRRHVQWEERGAD